MHGLLIPLEAVIALLVAVFLVLLGVVARRRFLGRGSGAFDCSLRRAPRRMGGGWRLGVGRYEADRVDWYPVFSFSPRPSASLVRRELDVRQRRRPIGPEAFAVLANALVVECVYRGEEVELAMTEQAYTGFAAWLEAAPPGQNVNVA